MDTGPSHSLYCRQPTLTFFLVANRHWYLTQAMNAKEPTTAHYGRHAERIKAKFRFLRLKKPSSLLLHTWSADPYISFLYSCPGNDFSSWWIIPAWRHSSSSSSSSSASAVPRLIANKTLSLLPKTRLVGSVPYMHRLYVRNHQTSYVFVLFWPTYVITYVWYGTYT